MSELISGKEAKLAWANGKTIEFHYANTIWAELPSCAQLSIFDDEEIKFRLKPRTVNLNGVEVGQLYSSQWDKYNPNKVTIEFRTEKEARHFSNNALKIFNGV